VVCIFAEATYRTFAGIYAVGLHQGGSSHYTALSCRSSAGKGVVQSVPVSVCCSRFEELLCIFCSSLSTSESQEEYTSLYYYVS
jgi:hypothetical protein